MTTSLRGVVTYSILDGSGNLVDAFTDRGAAFDALAEAAWQDRDCEYVLLAQDDAGKLLATVDAAFCRVP